MGGGGGNAVRYLNSELLCSYATSSCYTFILIVIAASQELYESMVSLRLRVRAERQQLFDLKLLFQYARKLIESAAEAAFLGMKIPS